ncbi:hypothetical protein [Draconibacterium sp.]|uniref:hypothetical protein n=1 Tax=Draconibacterium sp. TaxID=1965318 RepID=UPI00356616FF
MKTIYTLFILFATIRLCGQPLNFVPLDENFSGVLKFHAVDTVWVIYPEDYEITHADSAFVEGYFFWNQVQAKPVYTYKSELHLSANDFDKHLQFYGPFSKYKNSSILQMPVKQTKNGFSFKDRLYESADDAFFYMNDSATNLYTCRNSVEASFPLREMPLGFYPLNILHGSEFVINGYANNIEQLNDLNTLRARYFRNPTKTRFMEAFFAGTFSDEERMEKITRATDDFIDSLCCYLHQDARKVPVTKVYFYETRQDLQAFLAQPLFQTIYGKSLPGNNHITGLETQTLWHELGHTVIDATIGKNPNPFWHEGFRQFTDYNKNKDAYNNDRRITKEHIDSLSPDLISSNTGFFNAWHNYSISGMFVDYLIKKYGLEDFIAAYRKNEFHELFIRHGSDFEKETEAFKRSIDLLN